MAGVRAPTPTRPLYPSFLLLYLLPVPLVPNPPFEVQTSLASVIRPPFSRTTPEILPSMRNYPQALHPTNQG